MSFRTKLGIIRRCVAIWIRRPRLGVHVWLSGNPYSGLLYHQFRKVYAPQAMTFLEELEVFTRLPSDKRLLWIHSEVSYSWGRSGSELERAHRSYLGSLKRWSRKRGRLVWTIHDEGLHLNDPDPARVRAIRDKLRDMADYVHVHSNVAKVMAMERFGIEESRIVVVPHPSYATIYEHAVERERADGDDPRRLLCFGHVKPYKNYPALAAGLEQLGKNSFARLTIAGQLGSDMTLPEESFRRSVELDLKLGYIADSDVPQLFANAHFLVLPYTETLTSGAAALSMGFGVPIIAPDLGSMREAMPEANWPLTYAPDDPDGLTKALRRARDMSKIEYRALAEQCRLYGDAIHPDRISGDLVRILSQLGLLAAV